MAVVAGFDATRGVSDGAVLEDLGRHVISEDLEKQVEEDLF